MKDYISAYERTHFTLMQILKFHINQFFRGATC